MSHPLNVRKANQNEDFSQHLRIIVLGKTGNGKSSTVNSLCGQKIFNVGSSPDSITEYCEAVTFELFNRKILLVDTPGLADTEKDEATILNELRNSMEIARPGPHAFILSLAVKRFTKEEKDCVNVLIKYFGSQIYNYGMIIFTRVDDLETNLNSYVNNSKDLEALVIQFKKNYLGVNNRWSNNEASEMNKLIEFRTNFFNTLDLIIRTNSSSQIFTCDQFKNSIKLFEDEAKEAERKRLEEIERVKKLEEQAALQAAQIQQMQNRINQMQHRHIIKGNGGGNCSIQ